MASFVVFLSSFSGLVSMVLYLTGIFLPQHSVSIYTLLLARLLRIQSYLLWAEVPDDTRTFCKIMQATIHAPVPLCKSMEGQHMWTDLQEKVCAPLFQRFWPRLCDITSDAYAFGMILALILAVHIVVQLVSTALILKNCSIKGDKQMRKLGILLLSAGCAAVFGGILAYYVAVLSELDTLIPMVNSINPISLVLSSSKGIGLSTGFICLIVGLLLNMVQIFLALQWRPESDDAQYAELTAAIAKGTGYHAAEQGESMKAMADMSADSEWNAGQAQPYYGSPDAEQQPMDPISGMPPGGMPGMLPMGMQPMSQMPGQMPGPMTGQMQTMDSMNTQGAYDGGPQAPAQM